VAELTREAIDALDSGSVLGDALDLPHQLGDALWRADSADLPLGDAPGGLVVCGMGGSAIGADLAAAAIGPRAKRPLVACRAYEPPPWVGPDTLVLASSYSGDTEETLSCFRLAGQAGAPRVAVTTGGELAEAARAEAVPVIGVPSGMQPRSAVAYGVVATLACAEVSGAAASLREEVEASARGLSELVSEWGPEAPEGSSAKELARFLQRATPLVYGTGPTVAAAVRWKTQINENAKTAAFFSQLPEADHNEICAYDGGRPPLNAVFLDDPSAPALLRKRMELTAAAAGQAGMGVQRVEARGQSPFQRVMSLVLLGDLVSVYLAALLGVDPTPVEPIERFKRGLAAD
jgi:glucose/mannose-6-phosphate isomerase